jgi:hypothetical protein
MMVANNYYTPKLYNLTNSPELQEIRIWFKDSYGERVCLRTSYAGTSDLNLLDEIRQAVFRIELELVISNAE